MKAAYINAHGGPEVLEVGELPQPVAAAGEVVVKIRFAALNYLDIWVRKGLPGLKLKFPHVLCGDGAGTIEAVGPQVKHLAVGEDVIVHPGLSCLHCSQCLSGWESLCGEYRILGEHISGTSAEYVSVPAANVYRKPKSLAFDAAASIGLTFTTAWQMAKRADLKPGENVLVHAAGSGVSAALIQIAKLFGAQVIATGSETEKLFFARKLGAHHAYTYKNDHWVEEVRKQTGGRGLDVIFDHTGNELFEANIRALRRGGRYVTCGATSGFDAKLDLRQLFFRQLSLIGSTMGSKADFPAILRHFERGALQAVVDTVYPLEAVRDAHQHLEQRRAVGKVLLQLGAVDN